jgi:hypothetical protein
MDSLKLDSDATRKLPLKIRLLCRLEGVYDINARCQPPLEAVGCTPWFGQPSLDALLLQTKDIKPVGQGAPARGGEQQGSRLPGPYC